MRRGFFLISLSVCLLCAGHLHAQLFYNNGSQVAVTPGGILYVDSTLENAYGLFSNAGQTTVVLDFINDAPATATGGDTSSYYNVFRNWINDGTFTANQGNVVLGGTNQEIEGTAVTTFYNLNLQTTNTVKTQYQIDANVTGILSLNDCQLSTGDNNMFVLNTDTGAITRNNGFVSSTGPGRLYRSTNTTNTYSFPVGYYNSGVTIFRPVEFTPSVTDSQAFSVRFAYNDPTFDGYSTSTKSGNVISVDSVFYHLLKQHNSTASAALSIYYDPAVDGVWNSIGRWQQVPEWQNLDSANDISPVAATAPYYRMTLANWLDNGNEPHALINGQQVTVPFAFPNVFAPNVADPTNNNNTFHIINQGDLATVQELRIYDRWGEVVYDGNRDGNTLVTPSSGSSPTYCWNGKYKGKLQPMGNYVYVASVKILDSGVIKTVSGNLSLLW